MNENALIIDDLKVPTQYIAELAEMLDKNQISHIIMSQKLFPEMVKQKKSPSIIAKEKKWLQEDDTNSIDEHVQKVLEKYPDKVQDYQNGKTNLLGLFMGEIMRETKGKLNPKSISEILRKKLKK